MALEVGIVGLPGAGKTTLFTALTRTGGGEYGKTNVAMATVADERLDALARRLSAKKGTPRRRRLGQEGHPRRGALPGRARNRAGAAREPPPGGRAARRARRLLSERR